MADSNSFIPADKLSDDIRHPKSPAPIASPTAAQTHPSQTDFGDSDRTYQDLLDEWTNQLVTRRLARCDGNVTRTAQSLGISRSTMYALLKKYGLHGTET